MQAVTALAEDARFVQIDHAGHAPFLTHADEVADALLGFLAECPHPNPLPGTGEGAEQA
jgi:pimeloyl-[acyl-carrier protein] methyl ester esterase